MMHSDYILKYTWLIIAFTCAIIYIALLRQVGLHSYPVNPWSMCKSTQRSQGGAVAPYLM